MAEFKIDELDEVNRYVVARERLWFAADGVTVVADGDPEAASLFVSEGKRIPRADAVRLGLVKADKADKEQEKQAAAEVSEAPGDVDATDGAAEFAAEHGVDLASVPGSGKDGRVTKSDVEASVAGS